MNPLQVIQKIYGIQKMVLLPMVQLHSVIRATLQKVNRVVLITSFPLYIVFSSEKIRPPLGTDTLSDPAGLRNPIFGSPGLLWQITYM